MCFVVAKGLGRKCVQKVKNCPNLREVIYDWSQNKKVYVSTVSSMDVQKTAWMCRKLHANAVLV